MQIACKTFGQIPNRSTFCLRIDLYVFLTLRFWYLCLFYVCSLLSCLGLTFYELMTFWFSFSWIFILGLGPNNLMCESRHLPTTTCSFVRVPSPLIQLLLKVYFFLVVFLYPTISTFQNKSYSLFSIFSFIHQNMVVNWVVILCYIRFSNLVVVL